LGKKNEVLREKTYTWRGIDAIDKGKGRAGTKKTGRGKIRIQRYTLSAQKGNLGDRSKTESMGGLKGMEKEEVEAN